MITLPNLNTDNFYKFITTLGIVVIWFSNSELNDYRNQVNKDVDEYQKIAVYDKTNDYYIGALEEFDFLNKVSASKTYTERIQIADSLLLETKKNVESNHLKIMVSKVLFVDTTKAQVDKLFQNTILKLDSLWYEIQSFNRGIKMVTDVSLENILSRVRWYKIIMGFGLLLFLFGAVMWYSDERTKNKTPLKIQ